jgi:transposase InsO family protein
MCFMQAWQNGSHLPSAPDRCHDKASMRVIPMDLVGPARVCSAGRKRYVLVIVDDYSRYAWVFFLADKGETFGFVRDLILRLKN